LLLAPFFSVFLGFLICLFLGFRLGDKGCCIITTWCVFLATMFAETTLFQSVFCDTSYKLILSTWIPLGIGDILWVFSLDTITSGMLVIVTMIAFFVHLYSVEYMALDPHLPRFMSYLSLFTFFMLILVTSQNFLVMFIGWEGVGLCSFLLINFWHSRIQANKAAIKAILYNRVGDFFLLLAIFTILYKFNCLDYDIIFSQVAFLVDTYIYITDSFFFNYLDLICLSLLLGAVGKSAQLGLHGWLPDAMEGPTPVSALIHAATMVTAGVFLIIRSSFLFEYSPEILLVVAIVGAMTALFAATSGLFQNDIKRIIAFSTCSQLGYMVFACGLSNYNVSFFHLSNHAFFKALLFLGAGSIIHSVADEQDIRKMGGFKEVLPFSYMVFLIGSLALIGFPFLSGFYSKDIILEVAYAHYTNTSRFIFYVGLLSALFTAFYSTRLLIYVFFKSTNIFRVLTLSLHESNYPIFLPLFYLSICSIVVGYLSSDLIIGAGISSWNNTIFLLPFNYFMYDIEFLPIFKLLPLVVISFGIVISICVCMLFVDNFLALKRFTVFNSLYYFLVKKWYFDRIFNQHFGQAVIVSGYNIGYNHVDRGLIEYMGPSWISDLLYDSSKNFLNIQNGYIYNYLNMIFF